MKHWTLVVALLLAGCGAGGDDASNGDATPSPVAQVRTAVAVADTSDGTVSVYGEAEPGPASMHALTVPAEAIVATIAAPTGTAVSAGQAVATLRPSPATRAAIAKAASDARLADAAYARARRMRADGLMSDADVETARAAAASAEATLANLGITGAVLTLRAPVAGTVQGLTAKPGDQLAPGTTLATIGARGDVRARFGIDPSLATRVHAGEAIHVALLDGSHDASVPVTGVDPLLDPTTRLASVYVRLPAGFGVNAGTPLRATIATGPAQAGVSIPYAALLDDGGRSYVFVVRGGLAKSVDVSPGSSASDRIQILKGIRPGDRVVVEGGTALEDGMKVTERAGTTR